MARKNANGIGTVRKNKKRNRWEGRITLDSQPVEFDDNGRPTKWKQNRRLVTGATQQDVLDRLARLKITTSVDGALPDDMTVAQWLDHWTTSILPGVDLSAVTVDGYERMVRLYLAPHLGRKRLDKLSPVDVRNMLSKLEGKGLSGNTRRQVRSVLRAALRAAEVDGLVDRNVAALTGGVNVGRTTKRSMTAEQARMLLSGAPAHECRKQKPCHVCERWSRYGVLVAVLVSTGLRKGEALGLAWSSLNLAATPATLTVSRSLKIAADHTVYLDEPKTDGSRRTIHLPGPIAEILQEHSDRQHAEREALGTVWGNGWTGADLVFTTADGKPLDPHTVARAVKTMTTETLGEPWTPHSMRHTAASLLIAQGLAMKTVSETLGHSSIRVTADVYGHLFEPAKTEAADAMTAALFG